MYLTKMENQSAIPKKIMSPKNRRRESRVLDIDMYINSISLCYSKQQMKKILYVVTKSNWGGAQKYVYDLATSLDKNLYEPVVVLGSPHEDEQASGVLLERLKVEGVRSIEVGSMQRDISLGKEWAVFWNLLGIILKEKPDVVHLNSSKAGGLGAFAARICFVRHIIFTVHGWPFLEKTPGRLRTLMKFLSWLTVFLSHKSIVVSKDNLEIGKRMFLVGNKFKLIYNGVKKVNFYEKAETREILRKKVEVITGVSPAKDALWVGTIAEYTRNKSLDVLVHALAKLIDNRRDLKVFGFLIGDGEERKILETKIKEDGMTNHIFLTGFIPDAARLLKAFDVFTLVSQKEGHPYTLLEAGAASIASVGTNISGIQDILSESNLVEPNNPNELERILESLLTDSTLRQAQGKQLHEKVEKDFSFSKTLSETLALY